ncbi:hypothetical protein [Nonomuraea lactucae]|nr:hypothetical protein [Nonomuraea lactucae]
MRRLIPAQPITTGSTRPSSKADDGTFRPWPAKSWKVPDDGLT